MDNEKATAQALVSAGEIIEQSVEAEIDRLDRLMNDEDELERLREKRVEAMKKTAELRQEWLRNGHGTYSELGGEPDFFQACKQSQRVVCHFFRPTTQRCLIVDRHLTALSAKHVETRFIKLNVERCQFLVDRLKIRMLPTVAMFKDAKAVSYLKGFDELGGVDDFSTEMLEWRLARSQVLHYDGDLSQPPERTRESGASAPRASGKFGPKSSIRRGGAGDDEDDDDDE